MDGEKLTTADTTLSLTKGRWDLSLHVGGWSARVYIYSGGSVFPGRSPRRVSLLRLLSEESVGVCRLYFYYDGGERSISAGSSKFERKHSVRGQDQQKAERRSHQASSSNRDFSLKVRWQGRGRVICLRRGKRVRTVQMVLLVFRLVLPR